MPNLFSDLPDCSIDLLEESVISEGEPRSPISVNESHAKLNRAKVQKDACSEPKKTYNKVKLCILSNRTQSGACDVLDSTFNSTKYTYCHYRNTNAKLEALLANIDKKVEGFTMSDYCILMIGETDFLNTNNYVELVTTLRQTILKLTHTNVIICLPTYICGAGLYNCRVETFNNLMCLDILTHNYAILFDSNHDLTYSMFSERTGRLNSYGLQHICENVNEIIKTLIESSNNLNIRATVGQYPNNTKFFR